jgi:ABC-type uncharacterized transport system involved in gliding motility auxiliary subunit
MNLRKLSILGIALAVVLFVALNTWGGLTLRGQRLDLTENQLFTLSDGTRELLAGMEEPVTLRLYVSRSLREANPFIGSYADRVQDTLEAYAAASGGKLAVELIDPQPFSVDEDRAVGFGLQQIALEGGQTAYFGLAGTNSTDDVDTLPVLSPERERFLEYDLTRLVYNLANPEKPVVSLISGLPLSGDPMSQYRPWTIYEQLQQLFDIRYQGGEIAEIDPATKLLLIVQPQNLAPKTLYAIDQFVLGGGRAMVFVDPHSEAAAARQRQPGEAPTASDLEPLLKSWGVELVDDKIVGDPVAARQVQYPVNGRPQVLDYLAWLAMPAESLNRDDMVTAELDGLNFASAGWLKAAEGATTTLTPLVSSSAEAQALDAEAIRSFPDPVALLTGYQRGGVPMVMAARMSGPAKSAYPDALPEGVEAKPERLTESKVPIEVIVVADTDLLDDRTWLMTQNVFGQQVGTPIADNADFVANGMDYLVGSSALADLRGRDVAFRPFTRVIAIRRAAEAQYRAKEQELTNKLADLQRKLEGMDVEETEDAALLTTEQKQEVDGFRTQLLDTRRELRDVQHALRSDIEGLRSQLRFVNIAAVPILIAVVAIVMALIRRTRFRRRFDAAAG